MLLLDHEQILTAMNIASAALVSGSDSVMTEAQMILSGRSPRLDQVTEGSIITLAAAFFSFGRTTIHMAKKADRADGPISIDGGSF